MSRITAWLWVYLLLIGCVVAALAQQPAVAASSNSTVVVPPLVNFSGVLTDVNGKPLTGVLGVTFYLYQEQQGGAPLWMETQNVYPDKTGHYTVMLGSTSSTGISSQLFSNGEARWLGVQPQGQPEQPRISLLSVPYAMKAADAQTVGGMPASAFVLAAPPNSNSASAASPSATARPLATGTTPVTTAGGTVNKLAKFDAAADITNSIIFDNGTSVGIGNTSPAARLDVNGAGLFRGGLVLPTVGAATATSGKISQTLNLTASAFNSGTSASVSQNFHLQAEPAGNNTTAPSGTLNLLFGQGTTTPAETGLKISSQGMLIASGLGLNTTAPTQTLEVDSGNAMVKGPNNFKTTGDTAFVYVGDTQHPIEAIWNTGLAIGTFKVPQALFLQDQTGRLGIGTTTPAYALDVHGTGNFTGLVNFASGQAFPGTGTITGVTAGTGLSGGGSSGNVTLVNSGILGVTAGTGIASSGGQVPMIGIDTSVVPQLQAANTFTANQTVNGSVTATSFSGNGAGLTNLNVPTPGSTNAALLRWYSRTYPVGTQPAGMAFDGSNVWVANFGSGTVTKLSASSGAVVGTYSVGTGPQGVAFDGNNIWVTNYASSAGSTVTELLASSGAVVGTYSVGSGPNGVAFDGSNIWVTNLGSNTVTKLLASSGAVVGTYPCGTNPTGVAFDGSNIWVANYHSSTVTKLLASSGAIVGTYSVGTEPSWVAFDGSNIWVTNSTSNTVTKLLASSGAVVGTYPVGTYPVLAAFDGNNIWVANYEGNTVTKLLASSGAVVGTYSVGSNPGAVLFDGSNIWVTNQGSNTVTNIPVY